MRAQILDVRWSQGSSPDAMAEAFGEAALTVAVLAALLDDAGGRRDAETARRPTGLTR